MLRFRNPGTQYSTQVQVIKQLYAALGHQESFSLNDMAVVIAQGRLDIGGALQRRVGLHAGAQQRMKAVAVDDCLWLCWR